jgi:hypothetical protein
VLLKYGKSYKDWFDIDICFLAPRYRTDRFGNFYEAAGFLGVLDCLASRLAYKSRPVLGKVSWPVAVAIQMTLFVPLGAGPSGKPLFLYSIGDCYDRPFDAMRSYRADGDSYVSYSLL